MLNMPRPRSDLFCWTFFFISGAPKVPTTFENAAVCSRSLGSIRFSGDSDILRSIRFSGDKDGFPDLGSINFSGD